MYNLHTGQAVETKPEFLPEGGQHTLLKDPEPGEQGTSHLLRYDEAKQAIHIRFLPDKTVVSAEKAQKINRRNNERPLQAAPAAQSC
ncbi:hypothetical protein D3C81_1015630 [compost metagenome]